MRPDRLVVQGDTTTAASAALAAFYLRIPVAHVEAGLRTGDMGAPWPEELNRRLITLATDLHFAPTEEARANLLAEGTDPARITITGNTVIDALLFVVRRFDADPSLEARHAERFSFLDPNRRLVLVTGHRRESFDHGLAGICAALRELVEGDDDVEVVYPVHLNPVVRDVVAESLGRDHPRIRLTEPASYPEFIHLMRRAHLILSDSGGVQEEAPALGKPVLVLREKTERPEVLEQGAARLRRHRHEHDRGSRARAARRRRGVRGTWRRCDGSTATATRRSGSPKRFPSGSLAVAMSEHLHPSDRAPGLLLGDGVELGDGVDLGGHVIIHAGTRIAAGAVVGDGAVVGKPPVLSPASSAPRDLPPPATLEEGSAVLAGAIVFSGTTIGPGAIVGDQAFVRERTTIGAESLVGRGSAVDNDVVVGDRVRIQTNCYLTARSVVEDDVFVGPGATTTNDDTMSRHPRDMPLAGVTLRRASRIGGGAVICPGVEVGEEAFVAAGAVVTADVAARAVVMGVPARQVREVPEADLLERWR